MDVNKEHPEKQSRPIIIAIFRIEMDANEEYPEKLWS
jgi:hypothetical protein